mgnify:FL=1|jgi:hypothetical protein
MTITTTAEPIVTPLQINKIMSSANAGIPKTMINALFKHQVFLVELALILATVPREKFFTG